MESIVLKPKMSPKDFFMHVFTIIMLYISAFAFGRILFLLINAQWPDVLDYYLDRESLRWALSSLIIAYPVYLVAMRFLYRGYEASPEKKNLRIRLWLEYLTVFAAAVIILVTLMAVINTYLGGEMTLRFILKTLTVLYIAGTIFGYYFFAIKQRDQQLPKSSRVFTIVISVIALAVIVLGFISFGSPAKERARRFDQQRLDNLQMVQSNIVSYYQERNALPATLADVGGDTIVDPRTGVPYIYRVKDDMSFETCAVFETASADNRQSAYSMPKPVDVGLYPDLYNRDYVPGENCFSFTIKPEVK